MYAKRLVEDECWALVIDNKDVPCGYEICRSGFSSEQEAKKALEIYAKDGKWPNQVKPEPTNTEQDV